jgi:hypothetical protein
MSRPEAVPGLRDWDTADVIRNPTILNLYSSPTLGRLREPCESECPRNPMEFPDFVLNEGLHLASLMRLDQFAICCFVKIGVWQTSKKEKKLILKKKKKKKKTFFF